jgi:hypothetical protein
MLPKGTMANVLDEFLPDRTGTRKFSARWMNFSVANIPRK